MAAFAAALCSSALADEPKTWPPSPRERVDALRLAQSFSWAPRKRCSEIASCAEACYHLLECGRAGLDRDKDGIPCETVCGARRCR
ncbi:MAG: excalibur calcium-binding domain-containing protein [Pseudomonadota bacterium]